MKEIYDTVEILQLRTKFENGMMLCPRFMWITNSNDHRRV